MILLPPIIVFFPLIFQVVFIIFVTQLFQNPYFISESSFLLINRNRGFFSLYNTGQDSKVCQIFPRMNRGESLYVLIKRNLDIVIWKRKNHY